MIEDIRQYLENFKKLKGNKGMKGFKYSSIEDFWLQNGREMKSAPLHESYEMGAKKECFTNAFNLAMSEPNLTYCEGLAIPSNLPIPFDHAWCIDQEGNVVDNTWDDSEGCVYYGVGFEFEDVRQIVLESEHYGVVSNYYSDYKVLRGHVNIIS
jgi:hypothetical protein